MIHSERSGDGLATLRLDDGDKNALDAAAFEELIGAFDAAADARAIVLTGRDGIFTAGLNVKVLESASHDELHRLLTVFGRALMRVWLEPKPVVCAATGHAVAAGTLLAIACDHAVAADGDFRWGLLETRIDFQMPLFAVVLARHNVRSDRVDDLILPGAIVDPRTAVEVGYADELSPPDAALARAQARAADLADLPAGAYAGTKRRLRGAAADEVLATLERDVTDVLASR